MSRGDRATLGGARGHKQNVTVRVPAGASDASGGKEGAPQREEGGR